MQTPSTAKSDALYRFSEDGQACTILTPAPPRHWYNYLWNNLGYCAQVSQGDTAGAATPARPAVPSP